MAGEREGGGVGDGRRDRPGGPVRIARAAVQDALGQAQEQLVPGQVRAGALQRRVELRPVAPAVEDP